LSLLGGSEFRPCGQPGILPGHRPGSEPNEGDIDPHIADAMARLRTYAGWFSTMQPVAAAERVATDLGLFARAASGPAGSDRAGVLCKAIELLRSASRELWSPADLVEYLCQLVEPGALERHDGLPLRPHEGQAVRLMNLHQAKGLEAPIVFLAESSGAFQRKFALHVDRRSGTVVGFLRVRGEKRGEYGPGPVLAAPENWAQCEAEELLYREAELDRLLYVAATRAAVQLVIGRPQSKRRWEKLLAHVPAGAAMPLPPPASAPDVQTETLPDDAVQAFDAALRERRKSAAGRTWDVRGLKEMVVSSGRAARPGEHGTEWGSVIHVLLEAAMSGGGADLGALAASALEEEELDPARSGEALFQVQAVMASELWARAQAASQRLTEVPIQYLEPGAAEGEVPTIVRGVIDLVFREAGGWVIVDYKTDDRDESVIDELVERYAPQVRTYAAAWERLTGEPVAETGLFFVRNRRYMRIEQTEEAQAGA
jgi:ATP-dependent helicase/nuclease subunit A